MLDAFFVNVLVIVGESSMRAFILDVPAELLAVLLVRMVPVARMFGPIS
jgi:hypothetical protein